MNSGVTEVKTAFQKFYYVRKESNEQFVLSNDKIRAQEVKGNLLRLFL